LNGFVDHSYTRLGTTSTYNAIADLHSLQNTRTQATPQYFIVVPKTELIAQTVLVIISQHGPHRKHRSSLAAFLPVGNVFTKPLTRNGRSVYRIENTVLLSLRACMLRAIPSNGSCLQSHCLEMGLYATLCRVVLAILHLICCMLKRVTASYRGLLQQRRVVQLVRMSCVTQSNGS
jgi:hypothetical protein